jgi:hypothetical protein
LKGGIVLNAGNVIFNFKGDTNEIEKDTKTLGSKIQGLASGILKGSAVIGTAMTGITAKAVLMGGELEQQIGGTEAVFGKFSEKAQELSKSAFKSMGTSANEYMATINKMGSLMQGSGISQEKSLDLASKAMQRASDVASIMGIDISSAMESIAGAAKGNFTMMDNLGVAMNDTTLNAYALAKGIGKSTKEMTNAEKIELAMNMFLEKSSYAMGNYAKENETFAGSLSTVKASVQNLISGAGNLDDTIEAVQNFGKILVIKIKETAPRIMEGLIGLANGIMPMIPSVMRSLLPTIVNGIVELANGLVTVSGEIISVLLGMFPEITNAILGALPGIFEQIAIMVPDLMPQITGAVVETIPALIENAPGLIKAGALMLSAMIQGFIDSMFELERLPREVAGKIRETFANNSGSFKETGKRMLKDLFDGVIPNIPAKVKELWKAIKIYIKSFFPSQEFVVVGMNIVEGIWKGMKSVNLNSKVKGWAKGIINTAKSTLGIHSPSREFAYMGRMNILGLEKGMEDERGTIEDTFNSMFDLSPNLYGSSSLNLSPNVNVSVYNNMKQDALGQVVNEIKTFSNGSKNDFNYGGGI